MVFWSSVRRSHRRPLPPAAPRCQARVLSAGHADAIQPQAPAPAPPPSPLGRYQRRALLLTAGSYAFDNMWLQGIAAALPRVADEWDLTPAQAARFSSATFAGMMLGAFAWGLCASLPRPPLH